MHSAYKSDAELCKWLRDNSSGSYRLSAYAAERIETLALHLSNVQSECEALEEKLISATCGITGKETQSDASAQFVDTQEMPLVDGKWYWVKYESLHSEIVAPAMYKQAVDCFYSYEFSGIPHRNLTVLREA